MFIITLLFTFFEFASLLTGCEVKKGQWLLVPAFSIHNDPKNWGPDAASFVPERWLDSDSAAVKRAKNTFFAFGAGSRVCPGSRFALTEAKTTLVRLYQRCKLELAPNHEVRAVGFLGVRGYCNVCMCARFKKTKWVHWHRRDQNMLAGDAGVSVFLQEPLKLQATITMSAKNGVKVQPVARL